MFHDSNPANANVNVSNRQNRYEISMKITCRAHNTHTEREKRNQSTFKFIRIHKGGRSHFGKFCRWSFFISLSQSCIIFMKMAWIYWELMQSRELFFARSNYFFLLSIFCSRFLHSNYGVRIIKFTFFVRNVHVSVIGSLTHIYNNEIMEHFLWNEVKWI